MLKMSDILDMKFLPADPEEDIVEERDADVELIVRSKLPPRERFDRCIIEFHRSRSATLSPAAVLDFT